MPTNTTTRLRNAVEFHNRHLNGLGPVKSSSVSSWQHDALAIFSNKKRIVPQDLYAIPVDNRNIWAFENELLALILGLRDMRAAGHMEK